MEHIWSPWRYKYIEAADRQGVCVFCRAAESEKDDENYVAYRGKFNFVILNLYPYTSGHLMIVPYEHTGSLASVNEATTTEMMNLAKRAQTALEAEYHPEGFNIGMNLGRSAGAGVADHIHLHVVPRWVGDANFVSTIGETRVLPEDLATTLEKLKKHFDEKQSDRETV
ncbi:MAG TPA: HIT domain-containing protein [Blastocatellia bacterium]|nr:HIT domain-containing protein [Blastocatellia bacterium]